MSLDWLRACRNEIKMPTVEDLNLETVNTGEAGEPEPPKFEPVVIPGKNIDTEDEDDDDEVRIHYCKFDRLRS